MNRRAMNYRSGGSVRHRWQGLLLLLLVLLASGTGCTPVTLPAEEPTAVPAATLDVTSSATPPAEATEDLTMTTPPAAANAPEPVRQAIADLAERVSISAEEIKIVQAEAVVWPDGSLGCPEPGMMYPQVIVEGMKIILAVGGEEYHYHFGGERGPFLCENPVDSGTGSSAASD